MQVKQQNRTLYITDLPTNYGEDIVRSCAAQIGEIAVSVWYEGRGTATKGIVLDNIIIPLIVAALRSPYPDVEE